MLNARQLSEFNESGYLVVEDIVPAPVLDAVLHEYDTLLNNLCLLWVKQGHLHEEVMQASFNDRIRAAYEAGLDYFQPLDISLPPGDIQSDTPFHAGPAIFELMTSERLLDVVEVLIGTEITSNPIQHVRIKPPATELSTDEIRPHIGHTDWHQDRAVTLAEADTTNMVTVWVAISDATIENGCLQAIPKSHRQPMLRHCPSPQLSIPQSEFALDTATPLPVKAGGAVLFHPQTIHSSLDNNSDSVRWSFDLRYNVTGEATGRPMFPEFVARSRKNPATVMANAQRWRTMWEDARASLAVEQPVVIHRWPEDPLYCA